MPEEKRERKCRKDSERRRENRTGRGKFRQTKRERQKAGGHKVKDRKEDGGSVSNTFP